MTVHSLTKVVIPVAATVADMISLLEQINTSPGIGMLLLFRKMLFFFFAYTFS